MGSEEAQQQLLLLGHRLLRGLCRLRHLRRLRRLREGKERLLCRRRDKGGASLAYTL